METLLDGGIDENQLLDQAETDPQMDPDVIKLIRQCRSEVARTKATQRKGVGKAVAKRKTLNN